LGVHDQQNALATIKTQILPPSRNAVLVGYTKGTRNAKMT
jgi:hypothetical protein